MHYFAPRRSRTEVYLIFKLLNKRANGKLSLQEFYGVFDACLLNWKARADVKYEYWFEPFRRLPACLHITLRTLNAFVKSWPFRGFICELRAAS
jgi:hypothetical protein